MGLPSGLESNMMSVSDVREMLNENTESSKILEECLDIKYLFLLVKVQTTKHGKLQ